MDFNQVITSAFGLQDIIIKNVKLDAENLTAVIESEHPWGACRCQICGHYLIVFHQWSERQVRLPPWGIYSCVTLRVRYPRGECAGCFRVRTAALNFVHPAFVSMSCSLVETVGRWMEELTCEATARRLSLDPKICWKIDQWRMQEMKKHFKLPADLDCRKMSADEVHFLSEKLKERRHPFDPKWMPKFVTNLVATTHGKVIANASGREGKSLQNCLRELTKPQRLSIEFFSVDMHQAFMRVIQRMCPKAEIAIDRFHLAQKINEAFDDVRKSELWRAKKLNNEFEQTMLAPGRRFILVERDAVLSTEEQNLLGKLRALNDNIHNAMLIVDEFHKVLDEKGVLTYRNRLTRWYGLIRQARLKPLTKFALKVRKYRMNIEAYIRSNLTTAISEGINNKIRVLKAAAYGYTNEQSFLNKILQRCGFLNSTWMDTRALFYKGTLA